MTAEALPPATADAFRRLLDDTTPQVREALLERFQGTRRTGPIVSARKAQEKTAGSRRTPANTSVNWAARTRRRCSSFHPLVQLRARNGHVCCSSARFIPFSARWNCTAFLDGAALRCRQLLLTPSTAHEKCLVSAACSFTRMVSAAIPTNYHDPRNSFLGQVIQRRRGIPLSLSVLYILVAQRCASNWNPSPCPAVSSSVASGRRAVLH